MAPAGQGPHPPSPSSRTDTLDSIATLIDAGLADPAARDALEAVAARYAVLVPTHLRALIEHPDDPIGRQFVPHPDELQTARFERADPIGDDAHSPVPGVVHRYPDRALLKPLLACPTYCRFCFRREHVGPDGGVLGEAALARALDWLRATPAIREVILTGGDPLMLSPRRLRALRAGLDAIPHLELLRVHTRVPVATPARVDADAAEALGDGRLPLWLVLHTNHPRELSPEALAALGRLRRAGIPLLAQSVLLRGVNDDAATLEALFRALLAARVKPYYLHHLDAAPGTSRFRVPIAEGRRLIASLRGRVPGHALPTYVIDMPGGHGKVPLGPGFQQAAGIVRAACAGQDTPEDS